MKRIETLLLGEWDPIGISDVPNARDEYQSYAEGLKGLLEKGCNEDTIAAALIDIERNQMGLPGDEARAKRVARQLVTLL